MQLADVLTQVDGLNRRFVYYLESLGYIQPTRLPKSRIARRDYSEADVVRIRAIWDYYRRGFSVQAARDMAEGADRQAAYVLLSAPAGKWTEALQLLRDNPRVHEVAFVYGESLNIIARMSAPDETEVFSVLNSVFDRGDLVGSPIVLRTLAAFHQDASANAAGGTMQAYLLLKVPAKHAGGVLDTLRDLAGVQEASVVYGETDIIARVEAPDQDQLDDLIINRIQGIPAVESTRTFIVVGRMHWHRR